MQLACLLCIYMYIAAALWTYSPRVIDCHESDRRGRSGLFEHKYALSLCENPHFAATAILFLTYSPSQFER
jgi:hypothetical protein